MAKTIAIGQVRKTVLNPVGITIAAKAHYVYAENVISLEFNGL